MDLANLAQCASNCSAGRFFASLVSCITSTELCAVTAFGFFVLSAKMAEAPQMANMAATKARADTMVFTAFLLMA